ncbi:MAG TPA: hypothetical protein VFB32_08120 [Rudaea sp.]|nr:hypothetical protein [Rudaea sp.]
MKRTLLAAPFLLLPLAAAAAPAPKDAPSRAAEKGCVWEKLGGPALGLEAWVQRCTFGSRKVDLFVRGNSVMIRYSDGGEPEPLIDVFELKPTETAEAGIARIFAERTIDKKLAAHCELKPYEGDDPAPAGAKRYTFLPDAVLKKEIDAQGEPDGVPDPPCGDWGDAPDGIQYFEAQPTGGARHVMFVRAGQDEPLFDEKTLRLLPPKP